MNPIEQFEKLLATGQDNALLRYSLGMAYYNAGDAGKAIEHLARAVEYDPGYSAAWKLYGKTLTDRGDIDRAIEAYHKGIEAAQQKGDIQAGKEMRVFLRRLEKQSATKRK